MKKTLLKNAINLRKYAHDKDFAHQSLVMSSPCNTVNYHMYEEGARHAEKDGDWYQAASRWAEAADRRIYENNVRKNWDRGHTKAVDFCISQENRCMREDERQRRCP